jgi:hypothetical protein
MNALIGMGLLSHCRYQPKKHAFDYGIYDVVLPIHEWSSGRQGLLGVDTWNVLSIYAKDYGPRDGGDLHAWINNILASYHINTVEQVWLMTMPRVFGFAFNPVSFWFCLNKNQELIAVLCEVNNTFGEHHNYLVAHPDGNPIAQGDEITARKVFHVSPFFEVEGHYQFRFSFSFSNITAHIQYLDARGLVLTAYQALDMQPMNFFSQSRAFLHYPFVTLKVVTAILWHAVQLWFKKIPIFTKPIPPKQETTR